MRSKTISNPTAMLVLSLASLAATLPHSQSPSPFRAGVILVPLDIRVVDANGNPVTNLTASDFTIVDDGARQEIAQFTTQSFDAASAHRTVAIVLGRGRLNEPSKTLDAIIAFVSRLPPADRVAVVAYERATDPTTDHDSIVHLLERFRTESPSIEAGIEGDYREHPSRFRLSQGTRSAIDALFDVPDMPSVRLFPGSAGGPAAFLEWTSLLHTIDYLQTIDGEKQLILISEKGLSLGQEGMRAGGAGDRLTKKAAGARVTISIIEGGGLSKGLVRSPWAAASRYRAFQIDDVTFRAGDDRAFAQQNGGTASFFEDAGRALDRLSRSSSFSYMLGYYPTKAPADGDYRRISVTVRRPGVTVLYRHGYQARPSPNDPDELRRVLSDVRIQEGATSSRSYTVLAVKASATTVRGESGSLQVRVDLSIDPADVTFTRQGDVYTAMLDTGVYVGDGQQNLLARASERIDVRLDAGAFAYRQRQRIQRTITVGVTGQPVQVKAVVYDFDGDRLGTATARLR